MLPRCGRRCAEEQKVLDRTAELKALRLAREDELRAVPVAPERKAGRAGAKASTAKAKRARVSTTG